MLRCFTDRPPVPKLLDVGLAKFINMETSAADLTKPNQVVGSPPFMSPEQIEGKSLDTRAD